jgi:hypothetical protein
MHMIGRSCVTVGRTILPKGGRNVSIRLQRDSVLDSEICVIHLADCASHLVVRGFSVGMSAERFRK